MAHVNIVNQVLNKIGGECFQPVAATSAGGLMANASQSLGNMGEIMKVSAALGQHPAMGAAAGPQVSGNGSPVMNFVAGTVLAATIAMVNPVAGAVAGAIGAVHAGLQSIKPSNQYYSLAKSLAQITTNEDSGGTKPYQDASGDTYSWEGQKLAASAMMPSPKMSPIQYAAMDIASQNTFEGLRNGIQAKFRQQMDDLGVAQKALRTKYDVELQGIPNLDDALQVAELKQARPAPAKAFNIPSFG